VIAIGRLDGDRLKQAREALVERLTRATAETLRTSAKSENAELRRAALLAMSLKNDMKLIPDLIETILDEDDMVVRAARTGLKSLTDQDFGPQPGASSSERKAVVSAWREWLLKQKK
jgi:HEAT repeat protein